MPPTQCFVVLLYFLSSVHPTLEPCPLWICMLLLPFLCIFLPTQFCRSVGSVNSRCSCPTQVPAVPLQPQNLQQSDTYSSCKVLITEVAPSREWASLGVTLIPPSSSAGHSYLVALCPKTAFCHSLSLSFPSRVKYFLITDLLK